MNKKSIDHDEKRKSKLNRYQKRSKLVTNDRAQLLNYRLEKLFGPAKD